MALACLGVVKAEMRLTKLPFGSFRFLSRRVVNNRTTVNCICCNSYNTMSKCNRRLVYEELQGRGLIRVTGTDASVFLQGLITNDMRHFEHNDAGPKPVSMYSMFLNNQGRVLFDVIIYFLDNHLPSFLIECDARVIENLCKYLNVFKIRRKVEIASVADQYKVWVLFRDDDNDDHSGQVLIDSLNLSKDKLVLIAKDPRLSSLGLRLILSSGTELKDVVLNDELYSSDGCPDSSYVTRRYLLGVGEGVQELPHGNCFPLECNAEYLHGVSFHKGCYVGQELTARTHHTGVVRKRILPVLILCSSFDGSSDDLSVKNDRGKVVGKIRGLRGNRAIGLMRLQECLGSSSPQKLFLTKDNVEVKVNKPFWWPVEAPKENLATKLVT